MDSKNYQEDLSHIRSMMERSSRFISLSGLSGVIAGVIAIIGALYVYFLLEKNGINYFDGERNFYSTTLVKELVIIAFIILVLAVLSGYIFTARKSKKERRPIWDATSKRLLVNFAIPLITGGLFCLALLYHHLIVLLAPSTLVFYGLALVSASQYTFKDVRYLGYCQIVLGLISFFLLGWGLITWAIGFGVLHIIYGTIMHIKYR